MICKEIPKTMYCHIGGSGTWGCEFPEDLNMEGITLLKRDMEFETPFGVTACMKLYEMDASITADHKNRQVLMCLSTAGRDSHLTMTLPASAFSGH